MSNLEEGGNIIFKAPAVAQSPKTKGTKKSLPPVPQFADFSEKKIEQEASGKIIDEKIEMDAKNKKQALEQKVEPKKTESKPINAPSFPGQINLDLINKLYKQNKELQKDTNEKQESKPSQAISINSIQKIKDEYDPARPNDYESIIAEREKLRIKEEEEERQRELERSRMIEEEAQKIAQEEDIENAQETEEISTEEKVLRMLEKQGWKMGEGLGKFGQGMTTPLIAKKTASNTAIIVNSSVDMSAVLPPEIVAKKMKESLYNIQPTRVIVLLNMVTPEEVDESLQEEVANECSNFGQVQDVVVVQLANVPDEERIRIFVEFDKKESATTAFHNLYGRLFAGRSVIVKFYDEAAFLSNQYYNPFQ